MVTFDSSVAGTAAATWAADPRLHDRPPLPLEAVTELVVIAAHPDDETLGAGGLMATCHARGIPVRVIVVTDGAASGDGGIAARRSAELHAAVEVLAPAATVHEVGVADGATRENRERITSALAALLDRCASTTLLVAPWRGDGHRDHRVVGEIAADIAAGLGLTLAEYPIWLWHWGDADAPPWDRLRSVPIDPALKIRALACFSSQTEGDNPMLRADFLENFARDELLVVEPTTLPGDYFDALYARRDDPWGFETRWYEARKRAVALAALPDERYGTALEIGCSLGHLTEGLAARTDNLLAVDVSQAAVDRAAARVPSARVERRDVLRDYPAGSFDLVVLSEVGYYFSPVELEVVLDSISGSLAAGGTLVACHWRHPVADYPQGGDAVHAALAARGWPRLVSHVEDDFVLEVFSLDGRSVAQRAGLA